MTAIKVNLTNPQMQFMQMSVKFPAFIAGFGSGKTEALVNWLLAQKLSNPFGDVAYYAPTFDLIRLIAWPRFEMKLTEWGLRYTLNKSEQILHIASFGAVIFRTMANPERIIGYEVTDSAIDEIDTLPKAKATETWRKILGRNRQKKHAGVNRIANGTTPEGFGFIHDRWQKRGGGEYQMVRASTYSNQRNLPDDYIDQLIEDYPAQLIAAYINGQFVNLLSGAVYPDFDRAESHTNAGILPGDVLHIGMDFNVWNMAAVVAIVRGSNPIAVAELKKIRDTPAMIEAIKERYAKHSIVVYPDASGGAKSSKSASESDLTLLRQAGFTVRSPSANPAIKDRVMSVNAQLCNGKGERLLRINTYACPTLTEALEEQAYDSNGLPDKSTGVDHILDALGYMIHYLFPVRRKTFTPRIIRGGA